MEIFYAIYLHNISTRCILSNVDRNKHTSIALVHSIEEEIIMSNTKKDIKKIVLAYSGGLDTSVIIPCKV